MRPSDQSRTTAFPQDGCAAAPASFGGSVPTNARVTKVAIAAATTTAQKKIIPVRFPVMDTESPCSQRENRLLNLFTGRSETDEPALVRSAARMRRPGRL